MGGGCTKPQANYDVNSPSIMDHYILGATLGRGAFGVVKEAKLTPQAVNALKAISCTSHISRQVAKRMRFVDLPIAAKVMRQERSSTEGDSLSRLERQINGMESQIAEMESSTDAGNLTHFEELQWLHEYTESLKLKLVGKKRNNTKKAPRDMMLREVALLEKCDHPYIMQLVETFEDPSVFCVIFERCYGSVISRHPSGTCPPEMTRRLAYQLMSAVLYIHEHFILHRDIKPENLMFRTPCKDAEVLLGDFGMAVQLRKVDDRCQGCAGTPHFVPPEGFHSYYQSFPADIWACGCSIYWILLGVCPFEVNEDDPKRGATGDTLKTTALFNILRSTRMGIALNGWKPQFEHDQTALLARKICHTNPRYVHSTGEVLQQAGPLDFLQQTLCKIPKDRIVASAAVKHPWINGIASEDERKADLQ